MSETTPLMPRPATSQPDSHNIYLRACHSSWRIISPKILTIIRLFITVYLNAVAGVSIQYKMESKDSHTNWRIPFQFSSVTFAMLLAYNIQVTIWTIMHSLVSEPVHDEAPEGRWPRLRNKIITLMSPPSRVESSQRRFFFSLFYVVTHVFTFTNTIMYWAVLVPTGNGGFAAPTFSRPQEPPQNQTVLAFDPEKGLFEEGAIKAFSIINVWSVTSIIALAEVMFFNSIRRPTPVAGHVAGVVLASCVYLAWAGFGRLITGHSGLFFLDPAKMGNMPEAVVAACLAFVTSTPGIFSYMYGLIAMRESMTAHN